MSETDAAWLAELRELYEIVWASGFGENASTLIGRAFRLPRFPVIVLPPAPFDAREKVAAIEAFVGSQPAAWVDDVVTDDARAWVAARPTPTLPLEVDPAVGLTAEIVDTLRAFATAGWEEAGPGRANTPGMTTRDPSATLDDPQLVRRWERLEHGLARSLEESLSRRAPKPRRRRFIGRLFSRGR